MKNMSLERISCMFWIHFYWDARGTQKPCGCRLHNMLVMKAAEAVFNNNKITTLSRCCCVGVQINSSALETITKVCAWQVDKATLWEKLGY